MAIDVNKVIEQALSQAPAIIGAVGLAYWRIKKRQEEAIANQKRIEKKVNGNHQQAMRAIKLAGKYEGHQEARREVKEDLEHAVKTVKVAAKRGSRRATDKT